MMVVESIVLQYWLISSGSGGCGSYWVVVVVEGTADLPGS